MNPPKEKNVQRLNERCNTPPGGFRYVQVETGQRFETITWPDLILLIKNHRKANNIPIGVSFEDEIESQMCETLPGEWCTHSDRTQAEIAALKSKGLTLEVVLAGTKLLTAWMLGGWKKAPMEEITARAMTCSKCYFNQPIAGCTPCSQTAVTQAVNAVVGGDSIPYAQDLKNCLLCSCSLKAKVQLPLDFLQERTTLELNDQLPEWCWLKRK